MNMPTINGKVCVVNGKPVDKVYSNGKQVYGRNLLVGIDKAIHQASTWIQLVATIPAKSIGMGQHLCFSAFINNAPYVKYNIHGSSYCSIQAIDSSGNILLEQRGNAVNFDADGISQVSLVVPDKTDSISLFIYTDWMDQNTYYGYPKLEIGTVATPWTPAPEDVGAVVRSA
uniref:18.7 kDa protein n=1 Tax=Lactobacillus phage LL-K TaxID=106493 RepID=Q38215_9CAUD|nr:18.7 kDa protein [Lactobacillus phage LL-K]